MPQKTQQKKSTSINTTRNVLPRPKSEIDNEYYQKNKDRKKQQRKERYQQNKEAEKAKQKERYEKEKERKKAQKKRNYAQKKKREQLSIKKVRGNYYGAEAIRVLMPFKEWSELNKEKKKLLSFEGKKKPALKMVILRSEKDWKSRANSMKKS